MKAKPLLLVALAVLALAAPAAASDGDGESYEGASRGSIVVDERGRQMSVYDYFFNNPGKYRTLRYDPGEYYKNQTREYDR